MKKTEIDKEAQPRRRSPRLAGGVLFVPPQADRRLPRLAGRKLVPPVPPQALTTSNEYYSDADNETDLQRPVQALRAPQVQALRAPLVPQVPAPRAPRIQAPRDALMREGLVPPVPPQAPLAPQAPAQVAPQVQAQVAPRIQAPRDALMRGGLVPPVPPQAGEAALEENKSMVELMRNASTRVLNFLNDNQQIF
ncbi:MAG: hypothetical protein LBB17_00920, partial [Puniceicoccales bacterium]|nr:hypothetical protein [Puniceicoccales bacterium]